MTNPTAAGVRHWQTMAFHDAEAMMRFLAAIGFTEHATYRDEQDSSVVAHAEWLWSGGGGIMFGSVRPDGAVDNVGGSAAYLVCDDPDAVFDSAVAAGATVLRAMVDQDYGGRGGSVADPEGNHWSFGSYQPR
ncbi:VOC family protein [Nocardioides lijunqiniae]|uniref:VOC family protein n=1 Tax=Nocardioides lijunqiniae TaxID=2760832 RepID=UPI001878E8A8|nr:VOC family protein [Nocardioides lijunqiniae]